MSNFKSKFKKKEPWMNQETRDKWTDVQTVLTNLGFDNAAQNMADIMYARTPDEVSFELSRFGRQTITYKAKGPKPEYKTGIMSLDPAGMI